MAKNLHYEGLKPEAFDQFKSKLQAYGIDLSENSGSFKEKGVSGKYNYNPETEELELNDLSIGFPASMMLNIDTLASRLTETVVQHGGRPKQGVA
ncbi:hypothetical protein DXT99_04765 [Pontibacter diazotrophicus]|uniref:Uncharacterized protein n=1 Tax=Pontibacter diazotrophicus TaxID=1400979 RepID=A0A3D8LI00_9BACT|nr:hypothetical protein [Pontibacter diazotrophicus]RDV16512.1 hypothetical protein DXT99_04765 [Pontibacter diazotrophicus]